MPEKASDKLESGEKSAGSVDLRGLIDSLSRLFFVVSARLWGHRLREQPRPGTAGDSVDIGSALDGHLAHVASQAVEADVSAAADNAPQESGSPRAVHAAKGPGLLTGLAERLSLKGRGPVMQPQMSEQMQANTLDHINKAVLAARRGNVDGARMHTQLAQSAMRTASEYMSEDAYRAFKDDVEKKIAAIKNGA